MKRLRVLTALISGLILGIGPTANAAPSGPPVPVAGTFTVHCGPTNGGFDVTEVVTGSAKNIVKPDGTIISTSPNLKITLTANGKTLNYVVTGVLFFTPHIGLFMSGSLLGFGCLLDTNSKRP
ncbi:MULTISPECIES: hypothetical protein [unclassified Arthrobacter]|uniref:hypothetical protein n=1 Tax=unclassified Arthrobacter TaxID=235627 RepID=UPI0033916D54